MNGTWLVTDSLEVTPNRRYEGLVIQFRVNLQQRADSVVGEGEKLSENGTLVEAGRRARLTVRGTIRDGAIEASYDEVPPAGSGGRVSSGQFRWQLVRDAADGGRPERLEGRFMSEDTRSSGRSFAVREP